MSDGILLTDYDAKQVLVEAVPKLIVDKDTQTIVWINHKAESMFECPFIGELNGELMTDVIPERFREIHKAHWEEFWRKPRARMMATRVLDCRKRDGTEFKAQIVLIPCKCVGRIGCLVQFMEQDDETSISGILRIG